MVQLSLIMCQCFAQCNEWMASEHAKKDVRKSHDRLETFLKRALNFDTYERVRAHESCIVCSEKETRAFKFVILCDSWIYLMDNDPGKLSKKHPQKSPEELQKILSKVIHLQDIVSLSQVWLFLLETLSDYSKHSRQNACVKCVD